MLRASMKLENCTIANIYLKYVIYKAAVFILKYGRLTVKILRAYGGCLGTRSRRRTWTAAISRGETLNSL